MWERYIASQQLRKAGMPTPDIVIKKYENRRLYDTTRSRYVNLEEVAALIRKGRGVRVVDAKTGEDLTRSTLMQIIVEDNKQGSAGLPLEVMRQLIVASDQVGLDFLSWYLKSAFDAYGKVQRSFQSGLSDLQMAATSPIESIRNLFRLPQQSKEEESEIARLKKKLEELESQLQKRPRPRRTTKRARKQSAKR
jgi:polyhydroxyalkanoate synthesis repressor PhaR